MQMRALEQSDTSNEKEDLRQRIYSTFERRHALVENENRNTIAYQLKALRAERGWTQQQLGEKAEMKQAVISKYLNGWDNYSLRTLRRLGRAFDVALLVTYVPFSELAARITTRSYAQIAVPDAESDNGWPVADVGYPAASVVAAGTVTILTKEQHAQLFAGSTGWVVTAGTDLPFVNAVVTQQMSFTLLPTNAPPVPVQANERPRELRHAA